MSYFTNKKWFLVSLFSLLLLYFVKTNILVLMLARFLVNNFATGRSDFKVIGFLAYFSLCSMILFFYTKKKKVTIEQISITKNKRKKQIITLFITFILIGFLLNLFSFVYFIEKNNFEYFQVYHSVENGKQSSTQLFHIHNFKPVFAKVMNIINPQLNHFYDGGLFYANHLPSLFWILGLLIMFIIITFNIIVLIYNYNKFRLFKYGSLYITLYIIASYSTIKNIFDGGILQTEAIFWLAVLFVLLSSFETISQFFKKFFLYSAIAHILIIFPFLFFTDGPFHLFMQFLAAVSFLLALTLVFISIINKKILIFIGTIIGYIFIVIVIGAIYPPSYLNYSFNEVKTIFLDVPSDSKFYVYYPNVNNSKIHCDELVYGQDDFKVCRFITTQNTTLLRLLKEYAITQSNYNPIEIENKTCRPYFFQKSTAQIVLINGTVPEFINTSILTAQSKKNNTTSGNQIYNLTITTIPCTPSRTEVKQRILNQFGLSSYITISN